MMDIRVLTESICEDNLLRNYLIPCERINDRMSSQVELFCSEQRTAKVKKAQTGESFRRIVFLYFYFKHWWWRGFRFMFETVIEKKYWLKSHFLKFIKKLLWKMFSLFHRKCLWTTYSWDGNVDWFLSKSEFVGLFSFRLYLFAFRDDLSLLLESKLA